MSNPSSTNTSQRRNSLPEITGHSDDLEGASKSLPQDERVVLQVIDAPYDGTRPQEREVFSLSDKNIAEGMRSLPPHSSRTARILDVTVHSDFVITGLRDMKGPEKTRPARDVLIKFLQDTYTQPIEERRIFRWLNDPLPVNDIGSISSQWSQRLGGGNTRFYRLVNRTSLQQDPLDLDLRPRDSYLTCAQVTDDRLIVIIVNDVGSRQKFRRNFRRNNSSEDDILFENPRSISKILDGTSWTSLSDGSLDTFAKLLVLDFFLASIYLQPVDYYRPLIYPQLPKKQVLTFPPTKNPHLQVPLGLFEPRLSAESREAFKEIEDAEGILRSVINLQDSIRWVLATLKPTIIAGTQQPRREDHARRVQVLEGLCLERGENARRAVEALNRQLDYLTKRHAIREAKAIKILTILASLYLPLSLSASLLSMQSPFKKIARNEENLDGTNLLFDFLGVFIGLATATLFIIYAIRLGLWVKSTGLSKLSRHFSGPFSIFYYGRRWRYDGLGGRIFDIIRVLTAWWVGAGLCITLLVIFLVGMLNTAPIAWRTAKWMFTVYLVVSGVLYGCYIGCYRYMYYKSFGGGRLRALLSPSSD